MEDRKKYPSLPSNYVSILDLQQKWLKQKQQQQQQIDSVAAKSNNNGDDESVPDSVDLPPELKNNRYRKINDRRDVEAAKGFERRGFALNSSNSGGNESVPDSVDLIPEGKYNRYRKVYDRRDVEVEERFEERGLVVKSNNGGDREKKKMVMTTTRDDESVKKEDVSIDVKTENRHRKSYHDPRRHGVRAEKARKTAARAGDLLWIEKKRVGEEVKNDDVTNNNRQRFNRQRDVTKRASPAIAAAVEAEAEGGGGNVTGAAIQYGEEEAASDVIKTKNKWKKNRTKKGAFVGDNVAVPVTLPEEESEWTSEKKMNVLMNMTSKVRREPEASPTQQIEQKFVHLTVNDYNTNSNNNGEIEGNSSNYSSNHKYKNRGSGEYRKPSSRKFAARAHSRLSREENLSLVWAKKQ